MHSTGIFFTHDIKFYLPVILISGSIKMPF